MDKTPEELRLEQMTLAEEIAWNEAVGFDPGEARLLAYARRGMATYTDVIVSTPDDPGLVEIDGALWPSPSQKRYAHGA